MNPSGEGKRGGVVVGGGTAVRENDAGVCGGFPSRSDCSCPCPVRTRASAPAQRARATRLSAQPRPHVYVPTATDRLEVPDVCVIAK